MEKEEAKLRAKMGEEPKPAKKPAAKRTTKKAAEDKK